MSLHGEVEPNSSTGVRGMRVVIPKGIDVLLVTAESGPISGTTTEDQLMNLGKKLIDTALTPNFGWREDGQTTYIADPTEPSGNKLAVLARNLYEQRWVPEIPCDDEEHYIIYDLDKPAVQVLPLARTPEGE